MHPTAKYFLAFAAFAISAMAGLACLAIDSPWLASLFLSVAVILLLASPLRAYLPGGSVEACTPGMMGQTTNLPKMTVSEAREDFRHNGGARFSKLSTSEQIDVHVEYEQELARRSNAKRLVAFLGLTCIAATPAALWIASAAFRSDWNWWLFPLHVLAILLMAYLVHSRYRYVPRSRDDLERLYAVDERHRLNVTLH